METRLSRRIRSLREERDYSQKYIADKLSISPQAYSHYETGRRTPDVETIYQLALLYHVTMEYLITGNEEDNHVLEQNILFEDAQDLTDDELREIRLFIDYIKYKKFRSQSKS